MYNRESYIIAMDDQTSTQTITAFGVGQGLNLRNRSVTDVTFTVNDMTVILPAGDSFSGRFGQFTTFTVTCPGTEAWSYVVYG